MSCIVATDSIPFWELTSLEIKNKFQNILKLNEINDEVSEIIMQPGLQGQGLASLTHCVTVKFKNESLKSLHLFVKTGTSKTSHSNFLEETKLFEKESSFFQNYIPNARSFCISNGQGELMDIYPKCYFGNAKIIVLENLLLERGYELLDAVEQQNFACASLSLTTLAKHHAISYALMKETRTAPKEFFVNYPFLDYEPFITPSIRSMIEPRLESAIRTNVQILEKSSLTGKDEAVELLKSHSGNAWDTILKLLTNDSENKFLMLNHGDYWNNNMMFLLDKAAKKPMSNIAIDFQCVRYASLALDLSYFMYSSVKPEVRRNEVEGLLKIYLNVLNETSKKLGHPLNISYEELFQQYCKKVGYGVWFVGILTVCSAGNIVMKEIDISKVDLKDIGKVFYDLIQKWMEEHPEASEKDAKQIIELMIEYNHLKTEM